MCTFGVITHLHNIDRNKLNFDLLITELYKLAFKKGIWNFFESGHGKGVPDGVGGALK